MYNVPWIPLQGFVSSLHQIRFGWNLIPLIDVGLQRWMEHSELRGCVVKAAICIKHLIRKLKNKFGLT